MFLAHRGSLTMGELADGLAIGRAAADVLAQWSAQIAAAFASHPDIDPDALVAFLRTVIASLRGRSSS